MSVPMHKGMSNREISRLIRFSKFERTLTMGERLLMLKPGVVHPRIRLQCAVNTWPIIWNG